jgi:hypothetical protein
MRVVGKEEVTQFIDEYIYSNIDIFIKRRTKVHP